MPETRQRREWDDGAVFWGTLIGFGAGGCLWLFLSPIRGLLNRQRMMQLQTDVHDQLSRDPVAESLADGKALAKQHRDQQN